MVESILPDALIRIRDKYPASKCLRDEWEKVRALVKKGKDDEAEAFAKSCIDSHPNLKVRNKVAVQHRIKRREFLMDQKILEGKIKEALQKLSSRLERMLLDNADSDGKVPLSKLNGFIERAKTYNTEAWAEIAILLKAAIRDSVWYGIVVSMDSAQAGLDMAIKTKETYAQYGDPALEIGIWIISETENKAIINRTSAIFKTIFDRVQQRRIKQKLFSKRTGIDQTGVPLSRRIWDIRDWHLRRIRGTLSSGIADGRPASAIANDLRKMTVIGKISDKAMLEPGQGIYKSAYKNALRVVRTETNNAYVDAELEYAKQKGYKKMWNVNVGHRTEDSCDDLAGKIFDPEEIEALYPQHPNDACFMTTVIPGIG